MKKFFPVILFVLFGAVSANAQTEVVIREVLEYMSKGQQPGFEVAVPESSPDDVHASWKKYVRKQGGAKAKSDRKSPEMFADNADLPEVSANTVDLYSIARQAPHGTTFLVFVDLGGAFLSSRDHPAAFGAFQSYLRDFVLQETLRGVEDELKDQEKILKDLNKDLSNMIKDKDKYLKEIEKAKATIAEMESELIRNEQEQDIKRQQIAVQEEIISTIKQKQSTLEYKTR